MALDRYLLESSSTDGYALESGSGVLLLEGGPTRLYYGTANVAAIAPTVDAGWERNASVFARYAASTVKDNSALADAATLFGSTATSDTAWAQWVSDTLDVDQAIDGNISAVIRVQELSGTEDACLAFVIRVLSGDGGTIRGTLISHLDASIQEFNSGAATTRVVDAEALTLVNALAGDRLVIEWGVHGVTPDNLVNLIFRFGAPVGTADFARTVGLSTDLVPWFEFSKLITFGSPTTTLKGRSRGVFQAVNRAATY